ncbi:hypothetical protein OG735_09270 [Streptomyces sp. NBC_01210]|uniref:Rv1733c family protein n=1 Tax=Streptomyces sp. NBC_01210 TaxID=2903774 RepID=UPI002E0D11C7|nr:hypothetical protein OG735_09270 [Streptomyces sp. NBC_01210]
MRKTKRARVRGWRWRRNPLRRRSDAVEAWIVLVTWVLALIGGAVAGGVAAYSMDQAIERDRAGRQAVPAVLVSDAPDRTRDTVYGPGADRVPANVRWTASDGAVRTGTARVAAGTAAGATVEVWTDDRDRLVPEPVTPSEATPQVVLAGAFVAAGVGGVVIVSGRVARGQVERRSAERWGEEWERIGPQWRRTTG